MAENKFQKIMDDLSRPVPYGTRYSGNPYIDEPLNFFSNLGAGVIGLPGQVIAHPLRTINTINHPINALKSLEQSYEPNTDESTKNYLQRIGGQATTALPGLLAGPEMMDFAPTWETKFAPFQKVATVERGTGIPFESARLASGPLAASIQQSNVLPLPKQAPPTPPLKFTYPQDTLKNLLGKK